MYTYIHRSYVTLRENSFYFVLNVEILFLFIAFNFRFTFVTLHALSIFCAV